MSNFVAIRLAGKSISYKIYGSVARITPNLKASLELLELDASSMYGTKAVAPEFGFHPERIKTEKNIAEAMTIISMVCIIPEVTQVTTTQQYNL